MANNVTNVGFTDYGAEQAAIQRRTKLAEAMLQQGLTPPEGTQQIGGWAVKRSPWEGIAKIAQAGAGAYGIHQQEKRQAELGQKYQSALAAALQTGTGTPEVQAQAPLVANDDEGNPMPGVPAQPAIPGNREAMIRQLMQLPGAGQALAQKQMEPYSLAPGAQRYGGMGTTPVAAAPNKPLADNRPEIVRLQEQVGALPEGDPSRQQLVDRIGKLNHVPPTPLESRGTWGEPYDLGGAQVQRNDVTGQIRTAVTREPQVHVNSPPAVTTAVVIDPSNPRQQLTVDARTYRGGSIGSPGVVGVSGKLGDVAKLENKREFNMQGIGASIKAAEDLLNGTGKTKPTGSGVGAAVDYAGSLVGATPRGAAEADQLRSIGGNLVSKIPRMEGPQSDKDVALYKESAGRVGDATLPIARRKAALATVKQLYAKYEHLNREEAAPAEGGGWAVVR